MLRWRWMILILCAGALAVSGPLLQVLAASDSPYGISESVLRSGPLYQANPRISGKWLVWRESPLNQDYRLLGRNLETGLDFAANPGASLVWPVDVGGDTLVDAEMTFDQPSRTPLYGVFAYHLPDGQRSSISPLTGSGAGVPLYRSNPRTDGKSVVWLQTEGANNSIYGYDLNSKLSFTASTHPDAKDWPSVSQGLVTWRDQRNTTSDEQAADIYAFDISSGREFRVTDVSATVSPPAVSNGKIVWFLSRGIVTYLMEYDHSTQLVRTVGHSLAQPVLSVPNIDGNVLVWSAPGAESEDIFGYDLRQGKEFVISRAVGGQTLPSISSSTVVWEDRRNSGVGKYEADSDIYSAKLDTGPADPPPPYGVPDKVDSKVEIVWPQSGAPVAEADTANIGAWLFLAESGKLAACQWTPRVQLWRAVNNQPAQPVALGQLQGNRTYVDGRAVPSWEFNDVDVSPARDPANKIYFFVSVAGTPTRNNVWSHAVDARTYFPTQDVPTGIAPVGSVVDAKIEVVWPHDNAPVDQATLANLSATLFVSGTTRSVLPDWPGAVRLYRSLNNEVGREVAVGVKRLIDSGFGAYPVWDFNNVDVSAATDPANRYFFTLGVDGVETHANVWTHGADGRTNFPQMDVPTGDCRLS